MSVGFRVFLGVERPPAETVARLSKFSVPNLSDAVHGITVVDAGIRPLHENWSPFAGPAVTVDVTPGDGLLLRKAVELVQAGDVLVVNGHGCTERAVLGGNVAIDLANRGVAAVVVDGAVRDVGELAALGLPVFARGAIPRSGTTGAGWGEVNVPVACGGVVVFPGDIVVGDRDGLVVVPAPDAADVIRKAESVEREKGRPERVAERAAAAKQAPVHGLSMANEALQQRGGLQIPGAYRRQVQRPPQP